LSDQFEVEEIRRAIMPASAAGERFDSALAKELGISRNSMTNLLDNAQVSLAQSGKILSKSDRVVGGESVEIVFLQEEIVDIESAPLPIVYEDNEIVVIEKLVGYAVHPSPGWVGPTVTDALSRMGIQLANSGPEERQGIVHRLDAGTSGLMVATKTSRAYSHLKDQFRNREVEKVYHALAQGHLDPAVGTIDAPIDRHPKEDHRFAVVAAGRASITHYQSLEYFPAVTLVRIELETGRTHQIRVHFSALKHPLVGDLIYGADPSLARSLGITRPWLHAMELSFTHPASGERVHFKSSYPRDLENSIASLRQAGQR
jgi:23S rRNA pseudouridine1911/1915/1917 synthase